MGITGDRKVAVFEDGAPALVLSPVAAERLLHDLHSAVTTLRGVRKRTLRQRVERFLG